MKKAVFIERDGILNEVRTGAKNPIAPLTLEEFRVKADAEPALRQLKAAGFVLIVTTNQPGLSRGSQSRRELDRMHDLLRHHLPINDLMVCPHDTSDYCPCRTPRPGLLIEAAFKWQLNLEHSCVISDKWQDAEAARFAGCTSLLVQSPWMGKAHPDFVLPDLDGIVRKILCLIQPAGLVSSPRPLTRSSWEAPLEILDEPARLEAASRNRISERGFAASQV
jgi:D-glycero-D-manno-heptose 1,7-bisphosphate phosphatase